MNSLVAQFSAAGSPRTSLDPLATASSGSPRAVAVGSTGTIFVADTHNQRIEEWKAGSPPTFANAFTHNESHEAPFGEPTRWRSTRAETSGSADSAHDHVFSSTRAVNSSGNW